ncbi:MAG: hypothetical protein MUF00_13010 [Gemmatimonadaceae bacterium]|jgi:hypothetical protein|nr:hypothetical protein [Gemmatimonadaceae bacterium]
MTQDFESFQSARNPHRDEEQAHAAELIAARLERAGVSLHGNESGDDLADLLDAVEQFEAAVEGAGGDLMVDEPTRGHRRAVQPDNAAFTLPDRAERESAREYLARIGRATLGLRAMVRRPVS